MQTVLFYLENTVCNTFFDDPAWFKLILSFPGNHYLALEYPPDSGVSLC